MFNARYFEYDGHLSEEYGLQIVDFDENSVREADAISLTLSLQKIPGLVRFFHGGVEYDSAPTCEFCVLRQEEINASQRSAILAWLVGRKEFKALKFKGGDNDDLTYYCVFTSAKNVWINGRCYGFRLTAQFDSPFARGRSIVKRTAAGEHTITINNESGIIDDYTYPIVEFRGSSIDIVNMTDDAQRHFTFSGLEANETILVDNEVNHISSSKGGEKLSNFTSKNWLRLRRGNNELKIVSSGAVTIVCPHYVMIGY